MLQKVKALLPANVAEVTLSASIERTIRKIERSVKNYCNREDIPSELEDLLLDMVVDAVNLSYRDQNPDEFISAKSISEGDTQVQLSSVSLKASEKAVQSILTDYRTQLQRFRKLRW